MRAEVSIVCSACHAARLAESASDPSELRCPGCSARFPVVEGVIEMLPGVEHQPSRAQRTMEWTPLVRIYESRLWRCNPIVERRMGISFEDEYASIAKAGGFTDAERVLDLACGPGIYARRFARAAPEGVVVGLDLSPPMLAYAARQREKEGIGNLVLVHGSAEELPFAADYFDAANCCGALHLFPDLPRALAEVTRVLRPGSRFTAAVFRRQETGFRARASEALNRYLGLQSFTPRSLKEFFAKAGLSDFEVLHPGAIWLIASARKPG